MRMISKLLVIVGLFVPVLAACGDKDKKGLTAEEPCGPAAAEIANTGLPSHFPNLDGVVYTQNAAQGPSTQVLGYARNTLDDLYRDLKEKFGNDPYTIIKAEKDDHDAEVNFSSDEDKVSGQVALSEECKGRLHVKVVVRPL